jgi:hypothetical protein
VVQSAEVVMRWCRSGAGAEVVRCRCRCRGIDTGRERITEILKYILWVHEDNDYKVY